MNKFATIMLLAIGAYAQASKQMIHDEVAQPNEVTTLI